MQCEQGTQHTCVSCQLTKIGATPSAWASALWLLADQTGVVLFADLSWRPALASSPGMPTVTKTKKPARKVVKKTAAFRLPPDREISAITGLPVVKARRGQKPV